MTSIISKVHKYIRNIQFYNTYNPNIAEAMDIQQFHDQFQNSTNHRQNCQSIISIIFKFQLISYWLLDEDVIAIIHQAMANKERYNDTNKSQGLYIKLEPQIADYLECTQQQVQRTIYLFVLCCLFFNQFRQKIQKIDFRDDVRDRQMLTNIANLFQPLSDSHINSLDIIGKNVSKFNKNQSLINNLLSKYSVSKLENIINQCIKTAKNYDLSIKYCEQQSQNQENDKKVIKIWRQAEETDLVTEFLIINTDEKIYICLRQLQKSKSKLMDRNIQNENFSQKENLLDYQQKNSQLSILGQLLKFLKQDCSLWYVFPCYICCRLPLLIFKHKKTLLGYFSPAKDYVWQLIQYVINKAKLRLRILNRNGYQKLSVI